MAVEDTDTSAAVNDNDESVELEDIEVEGFDEPESENQEDESLEDVDEEADTEEDSDNTDSKESEEKSVETEDETEVDTEESKDEPKSDEDRKAYNKMMYEKRQEEKRQREAQIIASQKEYVTQAEDEKDAAIRQLQVEAYNTRTEGLTNKLVNGYERAVKDFPILNDESPEIQAEVSDAIDAFQAKYVTIDSFGNPAEVRADLYEYLQTKANSIERLTQFGARKQVDKKVEEKSKTFTPPSRAPKEAKIDPDLAAFYEAAGLKK